MNELPVKKYRKNKFNNEQCNNKMTFHECELAILRHAVDESEAYKGRLIVQSEDVQRIIRIVEKFIVDKKLICYGGTAINNILPENMQFYNKETELPDYDFFSTNALNDAKELSDIYYKEGYDDVEAKSGVHEGTFKVYVNFIPVADITQMHPDLFDALNKEAIVRNNVHYAPPNYLRMGMYLELSRPHGDTSRWEKVLKRLNILNDQYPLSNYELYNKCMSIDFQKEYNDAKELPANNGSIHQNKGQDIYYIVRDEFISQGVVFFGGYAASLYGSYMTNKQKHLVREIPDFDVISEDPKKSARMVMEQLNQRGYNNVKLIQHMAMGEIIPECVEIKVDASTIAVIYRPIACHNYNIIEINSKKIKVATIDTLLSLYLAFIYANKSYIDKDRILCIASFLFQVERENRLAQKGLLKRFTMECYGEQESLNDIIAKKASKYKELNTKRKSKEYQTLFLKYVPGKKREENKAVDLKSISHFSATKSIALEETPKENTPNKTKKNKKKKQTKKTKQNKTNQKGFFLWALK